MGIFMMGYDFDEIFRSIYFIFMTRSYQSRLDPSCSWRGQFPEPHVNSVGGTFSKWRHWLWIQGHNVKDWGVQGTQQIVFRRLKKNNNNRENERAKSWSNKIYTNEFVEILNEMNFLWVTFFCIYDDVHHTTHFVLVCNSSFWMCVLERNWWSNVTYHANSIGGRVERLTGRLEKNTWTIYIR